MNDLEQRVALAICQAAIEPRMCPCAQQGVFDCANTAPGKGARAALAELSLTPEQLEGLASDDMVVVPHNDWAVCAKFSNLPIADKRTVSAIMDKMPAHQQEEQP